MSNSSPKKGYAVLSLRYVIKSFRSFSFLRPPKAIFVPGMYFLGFSRYVKRVSSCLHPRQLEPKNMGGNTIQSPFVCWSQCIEILLPVQSFVRTIRANLSLAGFSEGKAGGWARTILVEQGNLELETYFGPTLFPPEGSVVWHCAHLVYIVSTV